jgi:hypothetical protein
MAAIAKRPVSASATTAEGEGRLASGFVLVAIGIHHFDKAVGIFYAQRTVLAHCNRDLRHETSKK